MKLHERLIKLVHIYMKVKSVLLRAWNVLIRVVLVLVAVPQLAYASSSYTLITLLHTNDLHGRVLPEESTGGLARIATMLDEIRKEMPHVVVVDAGDFMHGTDVEYITRGKAIVGSMNLLGYEAVACGNHEFDYSSDTFKNTASVATFPILSANIKQQDGLEWDHIKPYIIKEINNVKLAFFGLITLQTLDYQFPETIADLKITDPIETAKELVPKLREEADVVVCVSHLGFEEDKKLAKSVDGIDFIIGSHSHTVLTKHHFENNTLIAQTGAYGANLGRIDFIYKKTETVKEIVSINNHKVSWNSLRRVPYNVKYPELALLPVTENILPKESVVESYLAHKQAADEFLNEAAGEIKEYVTTEELLLEALRHAANSNAAIISKSGIKPTTLKKGTITRREIYNIINGYTRQDVVAGEIKIADLKSFIQENPKDKYAHIMQDTIDSIYTTFATQAFVMMDIMKKFEVQNMRLVGGTTREAMLEYVRVNR